MISVICPVYNEENYIVAVLDFCLNAKPEDKEIIFVDGGSKDRTVEIISQYASKYSNIKLLYNERKFVPFALNVAIKAASGDVIIRLDAHSLYAPDYFEAILQTFKSTDADIVGGPTRTAFKNDMQEAVAYAISTVFAVGGSKVHQENYTGYTDSVTFGAWKRHIFPVTGLFDERLIRNQDDEFHYRARSFGYKIYQSPDIKLYYFPRSSLKGLFKQYFQYGLYKPLVLKKVKSGINIRHLIPALFVLYSLLAITFLFLKLGVWVILPGIFYMFVLVYFSFINSKKVTVKINLLAVYPIIHLSYGLGSILGLSKVIANENKKI